MKVYLNSFPIWTPPGNPVIEPNWVGGKYPHTAEGLRIRRDVIRWCEDNLHFKSKLQKNDEGYYIEFPNKNDAALFKLFCF
jgi:hypothetical protein